MSITFFLFSNQSAWPWLRIYQPKNPQLFTTLRIFFYSKSQCFIAIEKPSNQEMRNLLWGLWFFCIYNQTDSPRLGNLVAKKTQFFITIAILHRYFELATPL